ncbi:RNA 2',3'-cyclic phosphodiesterase [uncultured archaeon]|nr:RNA 2',3'-cyclic phosphodiesterase [uncultured archaeon]
MRLFIATPIPDEIRQHLAEDAKTLREYGIMKTVEPQNIHITLKFLGETDPQTAKTIEEALTKIPTPPFNISIKGTGAFPTTQKARVIWAGTSTGEAEITRLHEEIENTLTPHNIPKDERFHAHTTLARVTTLKNPKGLGEWITRTATNNYGNYTNTQFHLIESKLTPQGPEYKIIRKYPT